MRRKWKIFAFISLTVIFCDQLSKYIVSKTMYIGQSIRVIGSFFRITYLRNPNVAFGIPVGSPLLMMVLTSIATILLIVYFFRIKEEGILFNIGLVLIIGGAIGNLIDRFRMRQVIDFIEIGIKRFKWPVFNIADSFVTIGIIVILYVWIFGKKREENIDNGKTNPENIL
ncbi:MAG: signal peptidase II [Candidatus Cloacimonadota bacterium]|nr:MAG: signal peptidase II [Candidatus Cloacimonadota bacterium]